MDAQNSQKYWVGTVGLQQHLWFQPHRGAKQEPWCTLAENQHGGELWVFLSFYKTFPWNFKHVYWFTFLVIFRNLLLHLFVEVGHVCMSYRSHVAIRGQSAVGSFPLCGSHGLCSGHLAWQEASWPAEPSHLPNWYDLIVRTCLKELGLCLHILTRQCVHMCMNTLAQVDTHAGIPYIQTHEKRKENVSKTGKKAGECHSRDMITQNNYYSTLEMTAEQGKNGLCVIACLVYISMHVHVRVGACEYECQRSSLSQEPCTLLFKQCLSLMWTSSLLLWLVSYKIHLSSKSQHQNHKLVWHLSF